jgi:hypothetical protein
MGPPVLVKERCSLGDWGVELGTFGVVVVDAFSPRSR